MPKECNGQCIYVRWQAGDITFNAATGLEATSGGNPSPDCLPPKQDPKNRLKRKAEAWASANSGFTHRCPDACEPCEIRDLSWQDAGERDIEVEDEWDEPRTFGTTTATCHYKAKGTAKMKKERGTGECWPKKIAMAIGFIGEDAMVYSFKHTSFSSAQMSKIAEVLKLG